MASIIGIANLALEKLGDEGEINSLEEDSRAARAVNACFADMRDAVLRDHPWDFARHRVQLPALVDAPAWGGWTAFQKPADFIRFVEVEWHRHYLLEGQAIMARHAGPLNLLYIRRIEDAGLFDPLFVDALACRIALQVAMKITGSLDMKQAMEGEYRLSLAAAKRVNGQEDAPELLAEDDWILARERG
ncbi:MAG: hypothetical protein WDA25_00980 [Paracoccaceae bacterium]